MSTTESIPATSPGVFQRFAAWARRNRLERKLVVVLLAASVGGGVLTFLATTGNAPVEFDDRGITALLLADMVLLLSLIVLIGRRLAVVWIERRRGLAGARLHARMVGLFGLVAALPTVVVAIFSAVVFEYGLRAWFSDQVSSAIRNSLQVAEAYLEEHSQTIAADASAMSQDVNRGGATLVYSPQRLQGFLGQQSAVRSLSDAAVIDSNGNVYGRVEMIFGPGLALQPNIPASVMERASSGELMVYPSESEGRVRAVTRLNSFSDAYLVIGRLIDPRVIGHIDQTRGAYQLYTELEGERTEVQITFALVFLLIATLLLMCSIWVGLAFANRLSVPVRNLIVATQMVRGGDLSARVREGDQSGDELDTLSRAFNRMTGQLESQQKALLSANVELDRRRGFIEAVLAGATAGVIGLDKTGAITITNRFACELLKSEPDQLQGQRLDEVLPPISGLLQEARLRPRRPAEDEMQITGALGEPRILLVRAMAEMQPEEGALLGYVITFDDITQLVSAQRKAAWADVARRIAHEIKNPLTPIQLAAERLKRRYLKEIESDPQTFEVCIDTIRRHVAEIGEMVSEFSNFARMPQPVFASEDLTALIEEALFLEREANPGIEFEKDVPAEPVNLVCDRKQVGRVLTNVLQNAADAIKGREEEDPAPGRIGIALKVGEEQIEVIVTDNGKGLPQHEKHRLTEPYVTTREKGTGLGLAIVKKIMEDHKGTISLEDNPEGGAIVRLLFRAV
jgi:two-component system nitrogen regulation sensor histidine kinase NtrY